MNGRRVVITGLGAVTAAGIGAEAMLDAASRAVGCTSRIDRFDPSGFACTAGGQVNDFSARDYVPKAYRKAVKVMARDIELAVAAADLAFRDAGLTTKGIDEGAVDVDGARFACNIGAGLICADLEELGQAMQSALDERGRFDFRRWGAEGMANLTPLWLLKYLPNMLACHVTIIHDLRGPSNTITCGEASGLLSIGEAACQIARGSAEGAVAGGAESRLNPMGVLRQALLGRLAATEGRDPATVCRPFDAGHAGMVIGEGAGLVVLETLEAAARRGAGIYAEVVGFAGATDPAGAVPGRAHAGNVHLAAAQALAQAGITPDRLDLVVAQGTGVPHEDLAEAAALGEVLGGEQIPVCSITGLVGNCAAGAGGIAAVLATAATRDTVIPPTANYRAAAAGCEHLEIRHEVIGSPVNYALVQAISHTGQSAALVLKRFQEGA
ncbi:MAG: beta-ketoacyl-[acyl-carrier-protein] synthase family protein [Planctomycetes bacterium]|nr:beta-ketoacyl-[acyl-carrier-protein] synthase family protein [Planctomycetota bacterium]